MGVPRIVSENGHALDHRMATNDHRGVKTQFVGIARRVIKNRKAVLVKTPAGYVQIVPFHVPDFVPPTRAGSIHLTECEIQLANRLGETL